MKKRKTILFVMSRFPFPASSGRKTSLYHYCRILHEKLGYRLVVAAFLETNDNPLLKPDFIDRFEILPSAGNAERIKNIIGNSLILRKYPLQVALYLSKKAANIVNNIKKEEKPDVIIGDMVRSTEYIKNYSSYTIADLDDRISLRYKRQLESNIERINPYGAFLTKVPVIIRKVLLLKSIKIAVVKNEINLLNRYELSVGRQCDAVIFVAEKEADDFNIELGENKAFAVPIGVDIDSFYYRQCGKEYNYIGFLGSLSVAHNENAVRHFIDDIFPLVLEEVPDAKFLVIGGGASEDLLKMSSDNVLFTGYVNDVRKYLEKCKAFVCPMSFGSGIKTKNLEAMAMGLPVVTTSIGAENIGAVDNQDWMVADITTDFAKKLVSLLVDVEKRNKLAKSASRYVCNNFSWNNTENMFKKLL